MWINKKKLDGFQRRTITRYASAEEVHFWIISVILTIQPMTFKMSLVSCGPDNEHWREVSWKYVHAFWSVYITTCSLTV